MLFQGPGREEGTREAAKGLGPVGQAGSWKPMGASLEANTQTEVLTVIVNEYLTADGSPG